MLGYYNCVERYGQLPEHFELWDAGQVNYRIGFEQALYYYLVKIFQFLLFVWQSPLVRYYRTIRRCVLVSVAGSMVVVLVFHRLVIVKSADSAIFQIIHRVAQST